MQKESINEIKAISSSWQFNDHIGAIKVRAALGRNNYQVASGLYKIGDPDSKSDVYVSANYKLSFDILRRNLKSINAWILVLDTKGINVWCAAGKGTFGTNELIKQIENSKLHAIVKHRRLIVPQLGAPGISAYKVKDQTGFKVKYGPVRASDIQPFLASGYKASETMRTVHFSIKDRLILTPVEISNSLLALLGVLILFFVLSGITPEGYSIKIAFMEGMKSSVYILAAYLSGAFITPVLLPWLPSRYFAAKGIITSGIVFSIMILTGVISNSFIQTIGWFFISISIASFLAMNFTGASTFTSLSGVKKEMRLFVPVQITLSVIGFLIIIISNFFLI